MKQTFFSRVLPAAVSAGVALTLLAATFPAHAAEGFPRRPAQNKSGVFAGGLIFGEPTGLSGKYWLGTETAIGMGFAYSFDKYALFFADYLFHFPSAFKRTDLKSIRLVPHFGGGAGLGFGKKAAAFGIRIPLGLEWLVDAIPLGVFMEFVPGMWLAPGFDAQFGGGIGARFYF